MSVILTRSAAEARNGSEERETFQVSRRRVMKHLIACGVRNEVYPAVAAPHVSLP